MTATQSDNQIWLDFTNTAREAPIYWDIEVTDGAGHYLAGNVAGVRGTRTQATGGQYSEMGQFQLTPIQGSNFSPSTHYCFRVRARTQAGKQGCVSELWNNPVCVTTPATDVNQFCSTYARDAINQLNYLRGVKYRGDCGDEGARWSNDWLAHYNWCIGVRGNAQTAGAPDYEREERNKRLRVCSNYECFNSVCKQLKPVKSVGKPPPTTPPPPPPTPENQCKYTVWITNDECIQGDSSGPMPSNPPGAMTNFGCGATEAEALARAKLAFYAEGGPQLSDDDTPCPGCCTYTKKVSNSCACPIRTYSYARKVIVEPCVRGMIRTAAGICRCPPGTQWMGLRCRRPASAPAPVPPPASAPSRLPPWPGTTTVNTCPSSRPVGTWPHCCPRGTAFRGGVCRRWPGPASGSSASSGTSGGTGGCPRSRPVGTRPHCCPSGTVLRGGVCRRWPASGSRPTGNGGANGTRPNSGGTGGCPRSRPVGTPPNCCPEGTVFSGHVCRRRPSSGSSSPGTGGANGTKPNTGTTCPRSRPVGTPPNCCPAGTVYAGHRCRRPTGSGSSGSKSTPTGPTPRHTLPCPSGQIGTPPNCHCPSGTTGPGCRNVIVH